MKFALGSQNRQVNFYQSENGSSQFYKEGESYRVKMVDVYNFFTNYLPNRIDLICINIEGGEYELLPRMIEKRLLNRCKNIQIQFHKVNKNSFNMRKKILTQIRKTHKSTFSYPFLWEGFEIKSK